MIKAIIFDMDGVVVDSEKLWTEVDNEFLKEKGIDAELSADVKLAQLGKGSVNGTEIMMKKYGIEGDIVELTKWREDLARKLYQDKLELKPNVGKFLDDLKNTDYKVGLATSASRGLLDVVVGKVDFDAWFSVMVTIDDVEYGKPAPDIYLRAAELLGVNPADCLVFEDAPAGARAAKAAGMKCIGVIDRRWENHELSELADKVIYDFGEINAGQIGEFGV